MRVHRQILFRLLTAAFVLAAALNLSAQGTAIQYQGRLNVSGTPANTNYDFRFAVYDAVTNGSRISVLLTNAAVPVASGLFTATLNFGYGVFNGTDNGSNYFLDIGVRAVGASSFTVLAPRQPILPVPYAIFATSANSLLGGLQATQLVGTVPAALIAGNFPGSVNFSNAANNFTGTFSGNGASLTGLNAGNITSGTLPNAQLPANVALLNASQTFSGANTFGGNGIYSGANTFSGPSTFSGSGTFSGVNTFSNSANYFQGNFFGNGLVGWNAISGTSVTATRDNGYLLQSASLTIVTLPASPSAGDIVRIAGGGAGGWLVKVNAGQTIIGNFASYSNGSLAQLSSSDCYGVAGSADGVRIYDSPWNSTSSGGVSVITGQGLPPVGSLSGAYVSLACSANGKIVYAEPTGSGSIIKSTNSGATWPNTAGTASGKAISCTADGSTLFTGNAACSGNGKYVANWSGTTITITNVNAGTTTTVTAPATPSCLAVSSDCTKLVIGVNNGLLYASSDQGRTWTTLTSTAQLWSSVWMSPDGSKFAAAVNTSGGGAGGVYYCSVSTFPNTSTTSAVNGGTLCGSQGSAVELQYLGSNQFMPVSSTGLIWAN